MYASTMSGMERNFLQHNGSLLELRGSLDSKVSKSMVNPNKVTQSLEGLEEKYNYELLLEREKLVLLAYVRDERSGWWRKSCCKHKRWLSNRLSIVNYEARLHRRTPLLTLRMTSREHNLSTSDIPELIEH
ncbi:hypothetical protein Tco_0232630 [Tanacetum coccineum]